MPDEDVAVPVSQELFEKVTIGPETPDATVKTGELPVPTEHTGDEYFQISYSSFFEPSPPVLKSVEPKIIPLSEGDTLYGAGYPGMNTMFYLDWGPYFENTTADTAPKAFLIVGADWTRYVLFENTNTHENSASGSVWVNFTLPTGDQYLGTHHMQVAIFNREAGGGYTDLNGMGELKDFNLMIVPQEEFSFCLQPEDCETATEVCDENYHLCVDK
jgi:hypothetical protein